jgi:hypothetical protein
MKFNEAIEKFLIEGPKDKLIKYGMKKLNTDNYDVIDKKIAEVYNFLITKSLPTSGNFFDDLIKGIIDNVNDEDQAFDWISKKFYKKYKNIIDDEFLNGKKNATDFADLVLTSWFGV